MCLSAEAPPWCKKKNTSCVTCPLAAFNKIRVLTVHLIDCDALQLIARLALGKCGIVCDVQSSTSLEEPTDIHRSSDRSS